VDKLAVTGDSIVLQPVGFFWQGWDGKLPLRGSNIITSEGKSAILEPDVMTAALQGMGKMYVSPAFPTPGTVLSLQLTVIPASLSLSVSIIGQKVVTAMTIGTYTATVVPAMNPQGVPDPLVTKVGQWTVEAPSQSSFRSGVPAPLPAPQDGKDGAGSDGAETESEVHWVGVTIEDTEGNPLANQMLSLLVPTGERISRKLGDSGAVRVDGIETDGKKAIASLIFDPSLAPVAPADDGYIAVNVVDEGTGPMAGREVVLTLPDGTQLRQTLNDLGHTRFVNIPRGAKCTLELVPPLVLFEFVLLDVDAKPVSDKPFKVIDSTGQQFSGTLDEQGSASLEVHEGECDVTVDLGDEDAGAGAGEQPAAGANGDSPDATTGEFTTTLTLTDLRGERLKNWPVSVRLPNGQTKQLSSDGAGLLTIKSEQQGELELTFAKESGAPAGAV
jgi:Contractile injection system spike tip protein